MKRIALALGLAACGGAKDSAPPAPPADAAPSVDDHGGGELAGPPLNDPADDDAMHDVAAEDLGAVSAWRAVVDRDQYLARRAQHGVVFGKVGGAVAGADDLRWLIDETEGDGALAIKVAFGASPPAEGTRVAVGGAWTVDDAHRWRWVADAVTPLPASDAPPPGPDPEVAPGLAVAVADAPAGSHRKLPDKASPGDYVEMTVVSVPARVGDGWGISSERYGTVMAYVLLPGEHPAFGGHDLRSPDEKWQLKKGATYWLRIGKVRRHGTDPPVFEAATPPVRFP